MKSLKENVLIFFLRITEYQFWIFWKCIIIDKYNEYGIVICVSNEQPSNAYFPIDCNEWGIYICVNDKHPLKDLFPRYFTEFGIFIWCSDRQPSNAESLIETINDSSFIHTFFSNKHPLKVFSSIDSSEDGIVISVNDKQSQKAFFLIILTDIGILIFSRYLHSSNEDFSTVLINEGIITFFKDEHL